MPAYLDAILDLHRARAGGERRDKGALLGAAERTVADDPPRGFARAIRDRQESEAGGIGVIAEIKRRSPSRGVLVPQLDPAATAAAYEAGGAVGLSVLTDKVFFGGSPDDLRAARAATNLPVLRKDFLVSELDVIDARLMGADAVLLIVAALDDAELGAFATLARRLGMDALVEVHTVEEMERAAAIGATMVGVNQRDLNNFEVDPELASSLAGKAPPGAVLVAESAISSPEDAERAARAGFDAVLVGEALVRSPDQAAAVRAMSARSGKA